MKLSAQKWQMQKQDILDAIHPWLPGLLTNGTKEGLVFQNAKNLESYMALDVVKLDTAQAELFVYLENILLRETLIPKPLIA